MSYSLNKRCLGGEVSGVGEKSISCLLPHFDLSLASSLHQTESIFQKPSWKEDAWLSWHGDGEWGECGEGTQCSSGARPLWCVAGCCSAVWLLFCEDKTRWAPVPALCTGIISKDKSFPPQANCSLTGAIEARGVSLFASQCQVLLQDTCSLLAAA